MESPIFASFKPIVRQSHKEKQEIAEYYKQNNLTPNNVFLQRYLESLSNPTELPSVPSLPKTEATSPVQTPTSAVNSKPIINPSVTTYRPSISLSNSHKQIGKQIMDFYISKGLTKEQAAGIAGNYYAESSFKTDAKGDNNTSFGIAQWHGPRWDKLKEFAKQKGTSENDFTTQLEFTWHELQTSERNAFNKLKSAKTAREAAKLFSDHFERPKEYNIKREQKAEEFYFA